MDTEEIKPDLKHDSMEFNAATDGDDPVDIVGNPLIEEDITADELDELDAPVAEQERAMEAATLDLDNDEDQLPAEEWTDDLDDYEEIVPGEAIAEADVPDELADGEDQPYPGI